MAVEQASELARRGHHVEILAGWDGRAELDVPGVSVKLFRVRRLVGSSFSGLIAPGLYRYLSSNLALFDVVHVHLARDLIGLPTAAQVLGHKARLVVQTHGMVMPDPRARAKVLDWVAMRRILGSAAAVLALTDAEKQGLSEITAGRSTPRMIANGIRRPKVPSPAEVEGLSDRPEVIFVARLHPRKRVLVFAQMALELRVRGVIARFVVVGPDEGDLPALQRFIAANDLGDCLAYEGTVGAGKAPERIEKASVFVLPSVGEVFPMTVLEALSVSTAVVLTSDCGISPELKRRRAAVVTDGSVSEIADAVERILNDQVFAQELTRNGDQSIDEYFSIGSVVDALESAYTRP